MRLHILSDLHQEFAVYNPAVVKADVVILAGDIHTGLTGIRWAQSTYKDTPVIYVAGNHEYYGKAYFGHRGKMRRAAANSNVYFLEQDSVTIGDITFLGTTLWTDMKFEGNAVLSACYAKMSFNDYSRIRIEPNYRKLDPRNTQDFFQEAKAWLATSLQAAKTKKTVVITHHGISGQSVDPRYQNYTGQSFFISELSQFICDNPCNLWVHGHVHSSHNYNINTTQVITNPRGYIHELNPDFDPTLCLDV